MAIRCEEFVNNYLPSVKARIVRELYEEYDLNQVEISNIFHTTQPAVSQYLRGVRGGDKLPDKILSVTKKAATEIYELYRIDNVSEENINKVLCDICKKI
ncbi:MAG: transcriptional regulator [Thermoplasmatota archaeon]